MTRLRLVPLALALVFAGCLAPDDAPGEEAEPTPPAADAAACTPPEVTPSGPSGGQVAVSSERGAFSYSGQTFAKTAAEVYVWENPAPSASVQWGGQSATGSLTLTLHDACGEEMLRLDLGGARQSAVQETTEEGAPGEWIVTLDFQAFTGQMGLSVSGR